MRVMYGYYLKKTVSLIFALSLSACSTGYNQSHLKDNKKIRYASVPGHMKRDQDLAHPLYKIGKPYKIKGKWYQPYEDFEYEEVGMASWYGPDCHGKKTATGERFNMHDLTAAHRSLPMPCMVQVTNLENNKKVVLRVTDRGPFAFNRIIDISRAGAKRLGFVGQGSAKVHVKVLKEPSLRMAGIVHKHKPAAPMPKITDFHPDAHVRVADVKPVSKKDKGRIQLAELKGRTKKADTKSKTLYIQAGLFANYNGARTLSRKLEKYAPAYVASTEIKGKNRYRVHLGPLKTSAEAKKILARLTKGGYGDAKIMQVS